MREVRAIQCEAFVHETCVQQEPRHEYASDSDEMERYRCKLLHIIPEYLLRARLHVATSLPHLQLAMLLPQRGQLLLVYVHWPWFCSRLTGLFYRLSL
jgi:hypothetical protein